MCRAPPPPPGSIRHYAPDLWVNYSKGQLKRHYLQVGSCVVKSSPGNFARPNLSIGRPSLKSFQSVRLEAHHIFRFISHVQVGPVEVLTVNTVFPCAHVESMFRENEGVEILEKIVHRITQIFSQTPSMTFSFLPVPVFP